MNYGIWLILSLVTGAICYFIAKKKGRNVVLWFVGGVFFSVAALAVLLITKNLKIRKGG